jgi:nitrate reductase assembly molybdenum cofactor insertion protein NarJ
MILGNEEKKLLQEAAEWHLLSLLFSCPGAAWRQEVAQIAGEIGDRGLRSTAEQALAEAGEGLYHSVFGPGGPAPPREASYDNCIQLGQLLSELAAYYEAFAYRPATQEVLDHVAVEAGFIAYLRMKQAYALANSDPEHAATAGEAAQNFIAEHLSAIAAPLALALESLRVPYLADAAAALVHRVGPPRTRPQAAITEAAGEDGTDQCGLSEP